MKREHLDTIGAVLLLTTLLLTAVNAAGEATTAPAGEARIFTNASGATMPYRLFIPAELKTGQNYPLVLCFHGAAGRGTENKAAGSLAYSVLTAAAMQKKHPAIIVAPQCPKAKRWVNHDWGDGAYDSKKVTISDEMTLALSIVDMLIKELPVDQARIYVTGRSMGGFATWDAIARRPNFFAAAIPIAGGGDPGRAAEWVNLPIWAIASAGDRTCPVSGTRVVIQALKKVGADIKYTEDPAKNHGAICNAWADIDGLADWLFEKRNMRNKPDASADKLEKQ